MHIVDLSKSPSIIYQYVAELRNVDVQKDAMRFRENIRRISMLMAFEISKELSYKTVELQTPLAKSKAEVLAEAPVIAFVLRAGMAMHQGFLDVFDTADNCFISAYRDEGSATEIKAHIEYLASPSVEGRTVILIDPMLATGSSALGAIQAIHTKGKPKYIHMACIVAAPEGIKGLEENAPSISKLWAASIDEGLDERAYIVPGLGDAGDLAYGEKS